MPKKPNRAEQDVHAMIVRDAKMRLGCSDFAPEFTIHEIRNPAGNWEVRITGEADDWPPNCAQGVQGGGRPSRRKFDIAWPW